MDAKMATWLSEEKHLSEMAHYVQFAPVFEAKLLRQILPLGIRRKDDNVLIQVLSSAARRYKEEPERADRYDLHAGDSLF
jgi:hypothetical protein